MRAKLPDHESFIERDGIKVHYEVYGTGPQTLMFLPGWAIGYARIWKAQLPYFSRYYRCIAFDPRGNGQSDRPAAVEAYQIKEYVDDAVAILDAENVDKAVMIGISFGGLLATILAAYSPKKTCAAITIGGSFPVGPDYGFMSLDNFTGQFDQHQGWQKFNGDYWRDNYPDFVEFFMGKLFAEPYSSKSIEDSSEWALETKVDPIVKTENH